MTDLQKVIGDTFLYLSENYLYPIATNYKCIENHNMVTVAQIITNCNQKDFMVSYLQTKILCDKEFGIDTEQCEIQLLEILQNS